VGEEVWYDEGRGRERGKEGGRGRGKEGGRGRGKEGVMGGERGWGNRRGYNKRSWGGGGGGFQKGRIQGVNV
jgi:hypothetical protein